MSKNILNLIGTLMLSVVLSLFLPWWSIMLAGFITGLFISLKRSAVFFIPFIAVFFYWAIYCYMLSSANDFILAKKISELLTIGGNPYVLILVTSLIGGIAAGVSGILGKQLSTIAKSK